MAKASTIQVTINKYVLELDEDEVKGLHALLYYGVASNTVTALDLAEVRQALRKLPTGFRDGYMCFKEIADLS